MPPPHLTAGEILKDLANLGAVIVLFWAYWGRADRHRKATILDDGHISFTRNRRSTIAWFLLECWLAWGTVDQWRHAHGVMDFFQAAMLTVCGVFILLDFPGNILVGPEGLEQMFWIGGNRFIRWDEIVEVNTYEKDPMITIENGNGTKIVHSLRLPDRARLLWEIQQHCADELPPEFPGEPMSGPDSVKAS